tara:strand:+ start:73212 stop:73850 length:639 start_codon:yes stop_codon:yes gene_type:complete
MIRTVSEKIQESSFPALIRATYLYLGIAATLVFLQGCGLMEISIDENMVLTPESPHSVVFAGADVKENPNFDGIFLTFSRYDKKTQRLIPGASEFTVSDQPLHSGLLVKKIEPGDYVLTSTSFMRTSLLTLKYIDSPDANVTTGIKQDAFVGNAEAYRFSIKPGEAAYLGEYVVAVFKPKWVERSEDVRAQMNEMPNISVYPVFRPPLLSKE